jgi:hypothetical protein
MCAQILWYVPQDFPSWPGGGHGWWLRGFAGHAQTRSLQGLQTEPGRARHRAAWRRTFRSKATMHGEDPALSGNLLAGKRFGDLSIPGPQRTCGSDAGNQAGEPLMLRRGSK